MFLKYWIKQKIRNTIIHHFGIYMGCFLKYKDKNIIVFNISFFSLNQQCTFKLDAQFRFNPKQNFQLVPNSAKSQNPQSPLSSHPTRTVLSSLYNTPHTPYHMSQMWPRGFDATYTCCFLDVFHSGHTLVEVFDVVRIVITKTINSALRHLLILHVAFCWATFTAVIRRLEAGCCVVPILSVQFVDVLDVAIDGRPKAKVSRFP